MPTRCHVGAGNRVHVLPGGEEGASGPPAILWDLSDAWTVCSCCLRKDGRSLRTFGFSYWDPLVVLATSLLLQSPCPLRPPCSSARCPMGSLGISTSLIGTFGHSCRGFIPTLLPHCFSAKLKTGILKSGLWKYSLWAAGNQKHAPPGSARPAARLIFLFLASLPVSPAQRRYLRHTPFLLQGPKRLPPAPLRSRTEALS